MSDPTDGGGLGGAPPSADVIQAVPVVAGSERQAGDGAEAADAASPETITEPAKLLRIASMVRELLDETRQASMDEPGRKRLAEIYQRAVGELGDVLSDDLRAELGQLAP